MFSKLFGFCFGLQAAQHQAPTEPPSRYAPEEAGQIPKDNAEGGSRQSPVANPEGPKQAATLVWPHHSSSNPHQSLTSKTNMPAFLMFVPKHTVRDTASGHVPFPDLSPAFTFKDLHSSSQLAGLPKLLPATKQMHRQLRASTESAAVDTGSHAGLATVNSNAVSSSQFATQSSALGTLTHMDSVFEAWELATQVDSNPMELVPLTQLLQEVLDLHFLARGLMSVVYKGVWKGIPVVLKFLAADTLGKAMLCVKDATSAQKEQHANLIHTFATRCSRVSTEAIQRLKAVESRHKPQSLLEPVAGQDVEYRAVNSASPPHLSQIISQCGVCQSEFLVMIIMEKCDMGSLHRAIRNGMFSTAEHSKFPAKMALRALCRTAQEIASGMLHLHSLNVVHKDLRPKNVLLVSSRMDKRGFEAKVTDIGQFRLLPNPQVELCQPYGRLEYMSPECAAGMITKAGDIYAFGVMLWEMYTGTKPFADMQHGDILAGINSGTLQPKWDSQAPARLAALSMRCCSLDPVCRPDFCEVFKELFAFEQEIRANGFPSASTK